MRSCIGGGWNPNPLNVALSLCAVLSPTTVNSMIRSWKKTRLSRGADSLGWPPTSIIGKVVELGPDAVAGSRGMRPRPVDDASITDAERVQHLVTQMPNDVRAVFEAYHLAQIGSKRFPGEPHKRRAHRLGMAYSTYKYRVNSGWHFLHRYLTV